MLRAAQDQRQSDIPNGQAGASQPVCTKGSRAHLQTPPLTFRLRYTMDAMALDATGITPRFWYCPLCGYMIVDQGPTDSAGSRASTRECPMCGEDTLPCWECISTRLFSEDWCAECDRKAQCQARFQVR